jgi:hypothetical protein
VSLSFGEASFLISLVAGIRPERAETFQSRLKQWQKMGFPEGTRVGRGVKAEYGATQIFQLALLVKLLRVGLTPERAQNVIKDGWTRLKGGIVETVICMANAERHLHYFFIQLDALSDLTTEGGSDHLHTFIDVFTDSELLTAWDEVDEGWTEDERAQQAYSSFLVKNRMAVSITIEIDSLLVWVWAGLKALGKSADIFATEIAAWLKECRETEFRFQSTEAYHEADLHNQSVALRDTSDTRVEEARAALSKVPAHDLNPEA